MKKVWIFVAMLIVFAAIFSNDAIMGQPRPYGKPVRFADTSSATASADFSNDFECGFAWFVYFHLNDDASGTGYLTTYLGGVAIEAVSIPIRPGFGWPVYAPIDSFQFVKADPTDDFICDAYGD